MTRRSGNIWLRTHFAELVGAMAAIGVVQLARFLPMWDTFPRDANAVLTLVTAVAGLGVCALFCVRMRPRLWRVGQLVYVLAVLAAALWLFWLGAALQGALAVLLVLPLCYLRWAIGR